MNEQRKAFEAWALSYENAWNEYGMRRNGKDEYEQCEVRMQWEGWQAAIASQAPRQALTDAEINDVAVAHKLYRAMTPDDQTCERLVIGFARDIIAASSPNKELVAALKSLYRGYVWTLEGGRDKILDLGGDCDSVEYMEAGDPELIKARAALAAAGEGA